MRYVIEGNNQMEVLKETLHNDFIENFCSNDYETELMKRIFKGDPTAITELAKYTEGK